MPKKTKIQNIEVDHLFEILRKYLKKKLKRHCEKLAPNCKPRPLYLLLNTMESTPHYIGCSKSRSKAIKMLFDYTFDWLMDCVSDRLSDNPPPKNKCYPNVPKKEFCKYYYKKESKDIFDYLKVETHFEINPKKPLYIKVCGNYFFWGMTQSEKEFKKWGYLSKKSDKESAKIPLRLNKSPKDSKESTKEYEKEKDERTLKPKAKFHTFH